jgi:protein involved in polysaccharide export with SLBB domain
MRRWLRGGGWSALALLASVGLAADAPASAAVSPPPAASWRLRYLLGPGDILNFAFYGRLELSRDAVFVQPDGTISYLQAQGIRADGRTIDELRAAVEQDLARYYKHVRVMIAPVELRSKRYFILGKVIDKGAFPMDRPITIIEAVARARGIETGLFEQNTVELADLARSFLLRDGRRMPVDFEKLFQEGDLSQNIEIEPGDYLYFPSANTNEIYILGEVALPGILGFTSNSTVVGAITVRGGFTAKAYQRLALVIRGSLEKPQRFVVNIADVLAGRAPDFRLQPKDIIYVSARPWTYVEDLANVAVDTFLQAMTATWTGRNIPHMVSPGELPQLRPAPTTNP